MQTHRTTKEPCSHPSFFFCVDALCPSQQFFSHVGTGLPGLNRYLEQRIKCFAQRHNTVTPPTVKLEPATLPLYQLSHCNQHIYVYKGNQPHPLATSGDKNISVIHLSCRTSDLQFSLVLQTHALVL